VASQVARNTGIQESRSSTNQHVLVTRLNITESTQHQERVENKFLAIREQKLPLREVSLHLSISVLHNCLSKWKNTSSVHSKLWW